MGEPKDMAVDVDGDTALSTQDKTAPLSCRGYSIVDGRECSMVCCRVSDK